MLCNWMQMGVYSKIGGLLHQHSLLRNINQNLVVSVHGISVTVAPSYHLILKSHCSVVWFPVGQVRLRSTLPALMLNIIHNFCGVGNMLWTWYKVAACVLYSAVFDSSEVVEISNLCPAQHINHVPLQYNLLELDQMVFPVSYFIVIHTIELHAPTNSTQKLSLLMKNVLRHDREKKIQPKNLSW